MIIKSIYINHFGCLKEKHIEFENGLNVISLPNESGKSTIAEFIRVMLYGVDSIRFNQRKKYMPFGHTSMGGEMTVCLNGTDYIITRVFGTRKADDKIEVINAVSGSVVKEYCADDVGKVMCDMGANTYDNTCYIKQLSAKINDVKSSEIQNRLINLTQSGEEEYSYRNAVGILDNAIKELKGPKGKINRVQSALNELAVKSAEKNKIKAEYERINLYLDKLNKNHSNTKTNSLFLLSWIPVLASAVAMAVTRLNTIAILYFALFLVVAVILTFKSNKTTSKRIEQAKEIGVCESRIEALKEKYNAIDVSQIDFYKQKLNSYNKALNDLNVARVALCDAFEQLQMDYSPKLNKMACSIFKTVTEGKYVDFMVDDDYNITVRNNENTLVSSEYLSGGTFDQIYFSLRMALVKLIGENMPVILDDAFSLYDDERLKKAVEYLGTIDNQVILFSCQSREKEFIERM